MVSIGVESLGEPQADLVFSRLDRVRAVADISSHIDGVVTADGAGSGVSGSGSTKLFRHDVL